MSHSGERSNTLVVYQHALIQGCLALAPWPPPNRTGEQMAQSASWFQVESLGDPAILTGALDMALTADVIVVAVDAAEELPLDLYVWIDLWLPRRAGRAGALAAWIGAPGRSEDAVARTREYLRAVARKGGLDFFARMHALAIPCPAMSLASAVEGAHALARPPSLDGGRRHPGWDHAGINE